MSNQSESNNVVRLKFWPPKDRNQILNELTAIKRIARLYLIQFDNLGLLRKKFRRERSILENEGSPFNKNRISKISDSILELDSLVGTVKKLIGDLGRKLYYLCDNADKILSMHDKAQVLSVSLTHIERVVKSYGDDPSDVPLNNLIFEYIVEYRGNDDYVHGPSEALPFFNITRKRMMDFFKDPQFEEVTRNMVDELFSDLKLNTVTRNEDGSLTIERMPPKLRIVKDTDEE